MSRRPSPIAALLPLLAVLVLLQAAFIPAARMAAAADAAPASAWAETEHGKVRLISAVAGTGDGRHLPLGIEFLMAPEWKIYWRTPGDAGLPPTLAWDAQSRNVAAVDIGWPAPTRFTIFGFETAGYADRVILPLDVRVAAAGAPVTLAGRLDYLTCKDICVPYSVDVSLTVPPGPAVPSGFAADIGAFAARQPAPNGTAGLSLDAVHLDARATPPSLVVAVRTAAPLAAVDLFVEGGTGVGFGAPAPSAAAGQPAQLRVPVLGSDADIAGLAGRPLTLTLVTGELAVEAELAVAGGPPAGASGQTFLAILAFALLGGLILNLMPCVLPVLSIKLLAVVGHGGGDRRQVRLGFLASAAGIAFSFLVLALALIAVKAAGMAAGWGLQFQQSWFLVAMTLVTTLFACNLWGLFEIPAPGGLGQGGFARRDGLLGHFLTGALATLLATPCSAPFLGTAVGFALARGPGEIIAVFLALSVGLALPYLAVAMFPGVATRLPKPGAWMLWLRRVLGIALAATALWLLTVLAAGSGMTKAGVVGGLALAIVIVLAARLVLAERLRRPAGWLVAPLAVAAFLVPAGGGAGAGLAAATGGWQPFDPARIAGLVGEGRIVFVNVTADWCLTCKVNERLVLAQEPVQALLAADDVVAMQGDWTRPDEGIARYLAGFGRYGIPFDAVYGPGRPQGEALPELLTPDLVVAAIARARGDATAAAAGSMSVAGRADALTGAR